MHVKSILAYTGGRRVTRYTVLVDHPLRSSLRWCVCLLRVHPDRYAEWGSMRKWGGRGELMRITCHVRKRGALGVGSTALSAKTVRLGGGPRLVTATPPPLLADSGYAPACAGLEA